MIKWQGGRRPSTPLTSVSIMCDDMAKRTTKSKRTFRFYRESIQIIVKDLESVGRPILPWDLKEEDIKALMQIWQDRGLTVATRRGYVSAMRVWLHYWHNTTIDGMEIRWPADTRPTVDWLEEEDAIRLASMDLPPIQELVIHCELCLGMRRVEILRSCVQDWKGSYVDILGKGPQGGKPRRMPYHPDTERILTRYLHYRGQIVALAKVKDPGVVVPDYLLIYSKGRYLLPYGPKGSGVDDMLKAVQHELGRTFSNHTLRRTFGRMMYRSGVDVATISRMMGHESQNTTLKYIGVNLDDMAAAMNCYKVKRS